VPDVGVITEAPFTCTSCALILPAPGSPPVGEPTVTPPVEKISMRFEPPAPRNSAPVELRLSTVASVLVPFWNSAKSSVPMVPFADIENVAKGVEAVDFKDSNGVVDAELNEERTAKVVLAPALVLFTVSAVPAAVGECVCNPVHVGVKAWSTDRVPLDVIGLPGLALKPVPAAMLVTVPVPALIV